MKQKEMHTAQSLAEMIILSTFIADSLMSTPNPNRRNVTAINLVNNARKTILTRVTEEDNSDSEIYDATEDVFNKYFEMYSQKDFVFMCRGFLGVYLRNYHFGSSFYNLFKAVWRYSSHFGKGGKINKTENIQFIKELRATTRKAELEVK